MVGREACWRLYTGIEHRKSQDRPSHHVICCMVPVCAAPSFVHLHIILHFFRRQAPDSNIIHALPASFISSHHDSHTHDRKYSKWSAPSL
jgi:hypothetical protein